MKEFHVVELVGIGHIEDEFPEFEIPEWIKLEFIGDGSGRREHKPPFNHCFWNSYVISSSKRIDKIIEYFSSNDTSTYRVSVGVPSNIHFDEFSLLKLGTPGINKLVSLFKIERIGFK